jgi:hypothetical protein
VGRVANGVSKRVDRLKGLADNKTDRGTRWAVKRVEIRAQISSAR